ncbi:hypothetical protein [Actinomadura chokoriensis]|uniref:hypothetical protein n=1 Tax=Actinomadura chokoriensis TaxID=454156 RepID=UPI0031F932BD
MPTSPNSWTHYRARIANAKRRNPNADTTDLERALKAARAEEYIRGLVETFPPLTGEQKARLVALFRQSATTPDGGASDAA